jgi:hypothetical protein
VNPSVDGGRTGDGDACHLSDAVWRATPKGTASDRAFLGVRAGSLLRKAELQEGRCRQHDAASCRAARRDATMRDTFDLNFPTRTISWT